jgi:hypothetical protein
MAGTAEIDISDKFGLKDIKKWRESEKIAQKRNKYIYIS